MGTAGVPSVLLCTGCPCQLRWRGPCGTEGQDHEPAGHARERLRSTTFREQEKQDSIVAGKTVAELGRGAL